MKPWQRHLIGLAVVLGIALMFLLLIRRRASRDLPLIYITVALIPLVAWLFPAYVRALARGSFRAHNAILGRSAFYLRLPREADPTFGRTVLMALGPFAIDLLVMAELLYLEGSWDVRYLWSGLIAFPILLVLAGVLTSLPPGMWLLDALDLRIVDPKRGTVARVAELYERILGPIGAVAALASFVTLVHTVGYSYEEGLFLLAMWTVRLFPPVLATTVVYQFLVEPRVLPALQRWSDGEGIAYMDSLPGRLATLGAHRLPERRVTRP